METVAKSAYMVDLTTHTVLMDKDADVQMTPSSMSKLMTVYLIFSRLKEGRVKLTDTFTVSEKAWRTQGSKTFVPLGGKMTIEDLLHGIITQSGNDACIVAAEGLSGSEEAFVKEMNLAAQKIGLLHSHFANSTGLPDPEHYMTPHDLALLAEHLMTEFPEYYYFFSLNDFSYNNIKQPNRNKLLGNDIGVDGLKTGHTDIGGYGTTLSALHDGRRLILVLNGMKSEKERMEEGDRLLHYGFREFENKTLLKKGQPLGVADVWFGSVGQVHLVAGEDVKLTLPIAGEAPISMTLRYNNPLPAPVTRGTRIGEIELHAPGAPRRIVPVMAAEEVPKLDGLKRMLATLKHYIKHRKQ